MRRAGGKIQENLDETMNRRGARSDMGIFIAHPCVAIKKSPAHFAILLIHRTGVVIKP